MIFSIVLLRENTQTYLQFDVKAQNKANAFCIVRFDYPNWTILAVDQIIDLRKGV